MKKVGIAVVVLLIVAAAGTGIYRYQKTNKQISVNAFSAAKNDATRANKALEDSVSTAEAVVTTTSANEVLDPSTLTSLQQMLSTTSTKTVSIPQMAQNSNAIFKQASALSKSAKDVRERSNRLEEAMQKVSESSVALAQQKQQQK